MAPSTRRVEGPPAETADGTLDSGMHRKLKNRHLQMISLGSAIGTGLFLVSGTSVQTAGPIVLVGYAIAGIVLYGVMRMLGEMAVAHPVAGSWSAYAREYLCKPAGFITGLNWWYVCIVVCMVELAAASELMAFWFPQLPHWITTAACLALITAANMINVKAFGEFEFYFTLVKVTAVLAMIGLGIAIIFGAGDYNVHGMENLWAHGGFAPKGLGAFMVSLVAITFSSGGIESLGTAAGEVEEPARNTPRAINQVLLRIQAHGGRRTTTVVAWSDYLVDSNDWLCAPSSGGSLGLRFRGPVAGPEQDLVLAFLSSATLQLRPGRSLSVFAEPAIDTGFPDLVAVVWRSEVTRAWSAERDRLRATDLRLLHLLATRGALELSFLREVFQRGLNGILTRLEEADVVSVGKSKCRARSMTSIFAVERIIAIEAKVSATQRALEQAGANTWFSSESHALLPRPRTGERLMGMASSLGVGLLGFEHDRVARLCTASVRVVPRSYGSWLFNEWTWRIARGMGMI